MSTSDGSTAEYYKLPAGATELQDLISHRNLNAQDGEIFRAIYRKGRASHSDELRDARKVLFYAQAEVKRLEKLAATPTAFGQQNMIDPADVEISEQTVKCKGCFAGCRDCCPGLAKIADEKLAKMRAASAERFVNECVGFLSEPASAIDDDSERMQAIGQNGEMASEVYAAVDSDDQWNGAPRWAKYKAQDKGGEWFWFEQMPVALSDYWENNEEGGKFARACSGEENDIWAASLICR